MIGKRQRITVEEYIIYQNDPDKALNILLYDTLFYWYFLPFPDPFIEQENFCFSQVLAKITLKVTRDKWPDLF